MLGHEVSLQHQDTMQTGKVKRRTLGLDGRTIGKYHDSPIMNSMLYDVEFPDGQVKEYTANVIADNIFAQVDNDGFSTTNLLSIVDYRRDVLAIPMAKKYITIQSGQKQLRKTTKGWKLLVQWGDGSKTWIPLKDLKESNPVKTAEFAKARGKD